MMCINTKIGRNALIGGLIVLYAIIVIRTAWLSDDAYITLRTVDNFVNGYGLRWNIAERVQAYTHPLWMFFLSGVCVVTHEAYFSTLFLYIIRIGGDFMSGRFLAAPLFIAVILLVNRLSTLRLFYCLSGSA